MVSEPLSDTFDYMRDEMQAAVAKHGWDKTPLNPEMSNEQKLIILVEEVGEVARGMTYDERSNLIDELIQTATMAAAWAQSLIEEDNKSYDDMHRV